MPSSLKKHQQGFTLLEAIVAMVIVSVISMSLYAWLNTSYKGAFRAIDVNAQTDVLKSARQYMETVNPMLQPEGSIDIGDYQLQWQSRAITPIRASYSGSAKGLYDIALYDVDITLHKKSRRGTASDTAVFEQTTRLVGYFKARTEELF